MWLMNKQRNAWRGHLRVATQSAVILAMLSACEKGYILQTTVASPSGEWIAMAKINYVDGPGASAAESVVCLARPNRPDDCTDVITYDGDERSPHITWKSDGELSIRLPDPDPSKISLQTIKYGSVRITLEGLPGCASQPVR
jgi:hypothetical protein